MPFIVRYPKAIPGPMRSDAIIENVDYALQNDLWWYNTSGEIASDWPDTWMVNLTPWSARKRERELSRKYRV